MPDLDSRIRLAATHWRLTLGRRLAGGTRSAVFEVRDPYGRDLVLKLPATRAGSPDAVADEAAALEAWTDTGGAIRLLDATSEALLLARARPGHPMPWRPTQPLSDIVDVAAALLDRLWSAPPVSHRFPTLADVYPHTVRTAREDVAFERRQRGEPDRGRPGLVRLPAASAAAEGLLRSATEATLLHGDFITKNLVSDEAAAVGWLALDPLPMVGERAAEVAAFAAYHPAELILPIAEALATAVGSPTRRVIGWAAVWTVHQATQAWRDDQADVDRLVESPGIAAELRRWR